MLVHSAAFLLDYPDPTMLTSCNPPLDTLPLCVILPQAGAAAGGEQEVGG